MISDKGAGSLPGMHSVDRTTEQMIRSVLAYAENRLRLDPVPLDHGARPPEALERQGPPFGPRNS